jgi:hypothetical protein
LLLYLQRTHFIKPQRAIAEWNRGNLDALVAQIEEAPALLRQLQGAAVSQLKSKEGSGEERANYVLITR